MFFCCENVLLAQTPRRKPVVKRATPVGGDKQKVEKTTGVNEETTQSSIAEITNPKLQPDAEVAVFEADYGAIVVELYPKLAPLMVERFKKLIREVFYNKTTFHRTSPSPSIIQGGNLTFTWIRIMQKRAR